MAKHSPDQNKLIIVYEPNYLIKSGILVWIDMFRELIEYRGLIRWLFSQGVISTASSLVGASSLLTKINFPKEVLVIAAVGQTILKFLIRIPLLLLIFVWTGFLSHLNILMVPFAMVPLLFLTLGIGFFISLVNATLRDIGNGFSLAMTLRMLVTSVVYPPPTKRPDIPFVWRDIAERAELYKNTRYSQALP